ncbi:MAG TPA: LPS assembly protein LptD [Rhizomicrobium sp.]|jgi:LPS-assembly protein|nr:LPS assembly protein LptD [Rhizomicrobium sp.]
MRSAGVLAFAACVAWAFAAGAQAAETHSNQTFSSRALLGSGNGQMLLKADQIDYDLHTAISTAQGHVEIDYNGRILTADRVIYDKNRDTVTAVGHVVMMAPNGDVLFAEQAQLTDQMKDGALKSFAALIGQNGRFVGAGATRVGGVRTIITRGAYTPCKICDKPGERTPEWQVRAAHVVYDEVHHRIFYRDAVVELEGVPVFYTPFFSHADPTVRHESGLLTPDFGHKLLLGTFVKVPYYIAFNDSQDATVQAMASTFGGEQLAAEYRQRWETGGMWLQASVADDPHAGATENLNQLYASLFGSGDIPLSQVWHFGYTAQITSYASYLQRYGISNLDRLNNQLFVEADSGRSRFAITGYFFQGLRTTDDNNLFPVVLPLIEYNYVPRALLLGGDFRFDVTTIAISRRIGEDDQRLTGEMRWNFPFVFDDGELLTIQTDVRGDLYHTSDVNAFGPTGLPDNQYITRGAPYVALDWRWPFVSPGFGGMNALVVEPIAQVIGAPYGDNPAGIPNETGYSVLPTGPRITDFQLDSTNIFDPDRSSYHDLVQSGPNANAGIRTQALFPTGSVDLTVGEAYRLKTDPIFAPDSGYDGTRSDIVSSLVVNFPPNISISDRIDVDSSDGSLERNEASVNAIYGRSSLQVSYLKLPSEEVTLELPPREEVKAQLLLGLWGNWLAFAAGQRDLQASHMISDEFGIGYDDECVGLSISYERNFTQFRELVPSTSIVFRFTLKTTEVPAQRSGIFPQNLYAATPL